MPNDYPRHVMTYRNQDGTFTARLQPHLLEVVVIGISEDDAIDNLFAWFDEIKKAYYSKQDYKVQ